MTFLSLQTRVQRRVIDLPTAVQAEVPDLINDAIRSIQRKYNFRAMEASVTMVTTEGSLVPTPSTISLFKEYRDKGPFLLQNLARAKRYLTVLDTDTALATLLNTDEPDDPEFISNSVSQSGVWTFAIAPYPNALSDWDDGAYRIVVPYYAYNAKLVADGDTNWFVDNADDYIVYKATGEAFGLNWDYEAMALWLQRADEKYQEIKGADKKSRLAGVDTFVPMWRGANQPQVRR